VLTELPLHIAQRPRLALFGTRIRSRDADKKYLGAALHFVDGLVWALKVAPIGRVRRDPRGRIDNSPLECQNKSSFGIINESTLGTENAHTLMIYPSVGGNSSPLCILSNNNAIPYTWAYSGCSISSLWTRRSMFDIALGAPLAEINAGPEFGIFSLAWCLAL
jgi:hypothetical protein